ncbi:hypothetical protein RND71_023484 [Anisodus tanguticus]|uniref:Uncharacterized protein n=1 Tax=Anisodus tanguticus TaxID=243964 RepID=A0AAE1RV86_9SOLA|nr:hypothetical protein RND71_023484 [Anisodus tanguticus]
MYLEMLVKIHAKVKAHGTTIEILRTIFPNNRDPVTNKADACSEKTQEKKKRKMAEGLNNWTKIRLTKGKRRRKKEKPA